MPVVKRFWLAIGMNLLAPGAGLVLLGRVWLGVAVAVWFALGAESAALGWLIAPLSFPKWLLLTGAVVAASGWFVGQGLLVGRIRFLLDPNLPAEIGALRRLAETEMAQGRLGAARSALRAALMIDDADLATRILWARLISMQGRSTQARRAWLEAEQLDTDHLFSAEIRQALDRHQAGA